MYNVQNQLLARSLQTFISGLVTHANAAKNSPRWNPSNLSVAHFLFSTAAALECNSSVTLGMDTEKIDFAFLGFFDFYPSLQEEAGVATRAKKSAVKYFSGNPSRANCDHVHCLAVLALQDRWPAGLGRA